MDERHLSQLPGHQRENAYSLFFPQENICQSRSEESFQEPPPFLDAPPDVNE